MRLRLRIATTLALLVALVVPALAQASGSAVIRDCTDDGQLSRSYSQSDYAQALAHLPADIDEYSDCRDVIRRAQLGGAGGGSSSNGGGGSGTGGGTTSSGGGGTSSGAPAATGDGTGSAAAAADPLAGATADERSAYQRAVAAGSAPVKLDGRPITPGTLGGATHTGLSDLPTPLIVILALLALGGLGAAGLGTRRLVLGRRTA
ncbi:hypothetical protein FSW04_00915 [Baekduia soli]|uniref:Uncharacterized protein n=1 Tax=Baekduia soli TaxID=496014 RepID=A0A5B8TZW9_9ACTN|nr:hypothetical protein [Baekduia soli]QEC46277.1 hypothetical protein FSW04_00915 [Baekduia soli]